MKIDLHNFCGSTKESKEWRWMIEPFMLDGKVVATNGHVLVELHSTEIAKKQETLPEAGKIYGELGHKSAAKVQRITKLIPNDGYSNFEVKRIKKVEHLIIDNYGDEINISAYFCCLAPDFWVDSKYFALVAFLPGIKTLIKDDYLFWYADEARGAIMRAIVQ